MGNRYRPAHSVLCLSFSDAAIKEAQGSGQLLPQGNLHIRREDTPNNGNVDTA